MGTDQENATDARGSSKSAGKWRPLRVWPVVILLLGMLASRYSTSMIDDGPTMFWAVPAFGPLLLSLLLMLWWLIASRARWFERLIGFFGIAIVFALTTLVLHKTMIGPAIMVFMIPVGMAMFGLCLIVCSRLLALQRTMFALLFAAVGFGSAGLLRADGMWGNFSMGFHWRWSPTSEQQLAQRQTPNTEVIHDVATDALLNPQWPEFRGSGRNGRVRGVRISSKWSQQAPKQLWKTIVGAGWSSFAVAGDWLFTQEQRENFETVVCYDARTGQEVWTQNIESRFDDPLGGPGPRATPTLAGGKLYTMGAQGWLLCINPLDGKIVWQQDVRKIADRDPPMWGFSSSPLVVGQVVIIHAGGINEKGVLAFDIDSGDLTWSAAAGVDSYSSPQVCNIAGEDSVAVLTNLGLTLLDPASGKLRFDYEWKTDGYRTLQPQMVGRDSMLLPSGMGFGTRLIQIDKTGDAYAAKEIWTSRQLKPDFNDLVVYQGHAYGFDALIFTCIDLKTGERKWKGGRYGKGQVLLIEDSGLLLVLSEQGELVLVQADPTGHTELAKVKGIEGRTWNHPVLIGNRLYIRNSQEAACYELPMDDEPIAMQRK